MSNLEVDVQTKHASVQCNNPWVRLKVAVPGTCACFIALASICLLMLLQSLSDLTTRSTKELQATRAVSQTYM